MRHCWFISRGTIDWLGVVGGRWKKVPTWIFSIYKASIQAIGISHGRDPRPTSVTLKIGGKHQACHRVAAWNPNRRGVDGRGEIAGGVKGLSDSDRHETRETETGYGIGYNAAPK